MKKIVAILISFIFLVGCMTPLQLEAEKAYYNAVMSSKSNPHPLVEIAPADASKPLVMENLGKLTVYAPSQDKGQIQQYRQIDYVAPWVNALTAIAGVAAPWLGAGYIVKQVANVNGTTSVSGTGNTLNYGSIDNTSVPTVVKSDPVIVNPVIVE
jgi:energy-converting hydrogenase Eha subunit F